MKCNFNADQRGSHLDEDPFGKRFWHINTKQGFDC